MLFHWILNMYFSWVNALCWLKFTLHLTALVLFSDGFFPFLVNKNKRTFFLCIFNRMYDVHVNLIFVGSCCRYCVLYLLDFELTQWRGGRTEHSDLFNKWHHKIKRFIRISCENLFTITRTHFDKRAWTLWMVSLNTIFISFF